ncbi:MAG: hypothetical protein ABSE18_02260 [Minisyncoccia bacterium]|jgi:hypothetical protein
MDQKTRVCQNCKSSFAIEPEDFTFYEKIKVPPPTWCPQCRFVRRLLMRNERTLYKRKCDLCGKEKIVVYSADSPFKVYCFDCWWSDTWDAAQYGRTYDFSRPFFAQYAEVYNAVPRMGIVQQGMMVESPYTNRVSDLKNCYLIFASANNENCLYGYSFWDSKDSMDCLNVRKSERCYDCVDCYQCANLKYSKECSDCRDSYFLVNCRNVSDCFGCVNLRNKQYCIFNEQYSKGEYQKKIAGLGLGGAAKVAEIKKRMEEGARDRLVPALVEYHTTDSSGNWIENSKNVFAGFNCDNVEEGRYLFGVMESKDVMDYTYWGKACELIYESSSIGRQCSSVFFSNESWDSLICAQYCTNCHSSSDLFGCVGMKKKQYCILNKQYSKQEYEALLPKVVEHMKVQPYVDSKGRKNGYGEFFPSDILPFAYNETIAQEYAPKTKEQALREGYRWKEEDMRSYATTVTSEWLADSIVHVDDDILKQVIACAHGGKCNDQCTTAFRLVPDELQFYRAHDIPLPRLCPNCRHYERLKQRTPIRLWKRACQCSGAKSENGTYENTAKHSHGNVPCPNEFQTSYAPDRPETVYCLQCYRAEVV